MIVADHEPGLSRVLADYLTQTSLQQIPAEVQHKGRLCLLDAIGCMIAGSRNRVGEIVTAYALSQGAPGPCSIFGHAATTSLEMASLVNGTLAHVLEMDDGHRPSDNHLGGAVVSASIAAAQHAHASGAELLRAVILGYDVMGRIGQAVLFPRIETPFHQTATTAVFGAAASAGLLFQLDADRLVNALGIAGTGGAGLREVQISGADCKPLQVGRGVQSGVSAALLAQEGLEGPNEILEGGYGFLHAVTPTPRQELITADLGERFAVVESAFKVHAACGRVFTAVDAAIELRAAHNFSAESIERVEIGLPSWMYDDVVFCRPRPPDAGAARFSLPFCVAAALKYGEVTARQISDAGISDPLIAAIEDRVEIVYDAEVDEIFEQTKYDDFFFYPAVVTVTSGGVSHRQVERTPYGYDPQRALPDEDVLQKFIGNTTHILGSDVAARVARVILSIESVEHIVEGSFGKPTAR